ncbi:hypothetical protein CCR75_002988 [Bremia lactucae]|uniref:Uncharacterized protein n=1 Tax=Bremia lactucae TaxID=4779 RepID=A0A976IBH7_BRELC|nr:hypothetical protein CCR75_002988 [Bremia lactucae]
MGWDATADGQAGRIQWKTTDNIYRWRRSIELQPELSCPTAVEPLDDLDHWGVLNVLSLMFPKLAPVEDEANVAMPQTKAALNHQSKEVRATVSSIISKPANWHPALDLIACDGQLLGPQY